MAGCTVPEWIDSCDDDDEAWQVVQSLSGLIVVMMMIRHGRLYSP